MQIVDLRVANRGLGLSTEGRSRGKQAAQVESQAADTAQLQELPTMRLPAADWMNRSWLARRMERRN